MIRNAVGVAVLLCVTGGFQGFDLFFVLTNGGPIQDDALKTIPTGLLAFSTRYVTDDSLLFSALSIVTLPMIVVYMVFNRQIVEGITAGSVK